MLQHVAQAHQHLANPRLEVQLRNDSEIAAGYTLCLCATAIITKWGKKKKVLNVSYNGQLQLDSSQALQQKNCQSAVAATLTIETPNALNITPGIVTLNL